MLHVLGNENIVTDQSNAGNQNVCIGDKIATSPQVRICLSGFPAGRLIKRYHAVQAAEFVISVSRIEGFTVPDTHR